MRKWLLALAAGLLLVVTHQTHADAAAPADKLPAAGKPVSSLTKDAPEYNPLARRGFRSPRMGYTGGNRARNPAANNPAPRTPAAPAAPRTGGLFGGFFGGLLAGSLISSLLNPFGFGTGAGVSLLGLLFWGVVLYFVIRFIRRRSARQR